MTYMYVNKHLDKRILKYRMSLIKNIKRRTQNDKKVKTCFFLCLAELNLEMEFFQLLLLFLTSIKGFGTESELFCYKKKPVLRHFSLIFK